MPVRERPETSRSAESWITSEREHGVPQERHGERRRHGRSGRRVVVGVLRGQGALREVPDHWIVIATDHRAAAPACPLESAGAPAGHRRRARRPSATAEARRAVASRSTWRVVRAAQRRCGRRSSAMASNTGWTSVGEDAIGPAGSRPWPSARSSASPSSAFARLQLLEQAHVLDGDHRLVGEGPEQRDRAPRHDAEGSRRPPRRCRA